LLTHYKRAPLSGGLEASARTRRKRAPSIDSKKYIAMDVHQATISVAVMDAAGYTDPKVAVILTTPETRIIRCAAAAFLFLCV
jgi:hypothetical protein